MAGPKSNQFACPTACGRTFNSPSSANSHMRNSKLCQERSEKIREAAALAGHAPRRPSLPGHERPTTRASRRSSSPRNSDRAVSAAHDRARERWARDEEERKQRELEARAYLAERRANTGREPQKDTRGTGKVVRIGAGESYQGTGWRPPSERGRSRSRTPIEKRERAASPRISGVGPATIDRYRSGDNARARRASPPSLPNGAPEMEPWKKVECLKREEEAKAYLAKRSVSQEQQIDRYDQYTPRTSSPMRDSKRELGRDRDISQEIYGKKQARLSKDDDETKSSPFLRHVPLSLSGESYAYGIFEHVEIQGKTIHFDSNEDWSPQKLGGDGIEAIIFGPEFHIKDNHILAIVAAGQTLCRSLLAFRAGTLFGGATSKSDLTDMAVILLAASCPKLRHLSLAGSPSITSKSLLSCLVNCTELRYIAITGCSSSPGSIGTSGIDILRQQPDIGRHLKKLCLVDQVPAELLKSFDLLTAARETLVIVHGLSDFGDVRFWEGKKRKYASNTTKTMLASAGWSDTLDSRAEFVDSLKRPPMDFPEQPNVPRKRRRESSPMDLGAQFHDRKQDLSTNDTNPQQKPSPAQPLYGQLHELLGKIKTLKERNSELEALHEGRNPPNGQLQELLAKNKALAERNMKFEELKEDRNSLAAQVQDLVEKNKTLAQRNSELETDDELLGTAPGNTVELKVLRTRCKEFEQIKKELRNERDRLKIQVKLLQSRSDKAVNEHGTISRKHSLLLEGFTKLKEENQLLQDEYIQLSLQHNMLQSHERRENMPIKKEGL